MAAIIRVVDDLPFDPTTWIEAKRRCGMPSAVISLCIRSSPNRMPNSSRPRRYSSAWRALQAMCSGVLAEPVEAAAVLLELGPLALDDIGRSLVHEPVVRELGLQARNLGH